MKHHKQQRRKFQGLAGSPLATIVPDEPTTPTLIIEEEPIPEIVLVHKCLMPEMKNCRCKKTVPYSEAVKMVQHGEAGWVQVVTATGYKTVHALFAVMGSKVKRANVPNAGAAEVLAESSFADKQNRAPDIAGLVETAEATQEQAQNSQIIHSGGKSVGGVIQTTTRKLPNGKEESRGTFDESSYPTMTGDPMEYTDKDGKPRRPPARKLDKSGAGVSGEDDYREDSSA